MGPTKSKPMYEMAKGWINYAIQLLEYEFDYFGRNA